MEVMECTAVAAILDFICPRFGIGLLVPDLPLLKAVARTAVTLLLMVLNGGKLCSESCCLCWPLLGYAVVLVIPLYIEVLETGAVVCRNRGRFVRERGTLIVVFWWEDMPANFI